MHPGGSTIGPSFEFDIIPNPAEGEEPPPLSFTGRLYSLPAACELAVGNVLRDGLDGGKDGSISLGFEPVAPTGAHGNGSAESYFQLLADVIGDESTSRIIQIAHEAGMTLEQKMEAISLIDRRFTGKQSSEWGVILGRTSNAVRKTAPWKRWRAARKAID